jgi:hypothetical protein
MVLKVKDVVTTGDRTVTSEVDLPPELVETYGSLYQNASSPVVFSASNTIPTPWNSGNAGTISAGGSNNITPDTTTGELILDEAGAYDIAFTGSVGSTNANVQLCAQVFIDGVGQGNMCDFPTTSATAGKYVSFGGGDLTLSDVTAGQKVDVRFVSLESQSEDIKLRNFNLKAEKRNKS